LLNADQQGSCMQDISAETNIWWSSKKNLRS